MPQHDAEEQPTPQSIAAYVKKNAARARKAQSHDHGGSVVTRETEYKGHHIVVRTKYEVEVDGQQLMGHFGVNDEGSVHYHPVPNLSFPSALDMVKKIIDVFPQDFRHDADAPPMTHGSHKMRPTGATKKKVPAPKKTSQKGRK